MAFTAYSSPVWQTKNKACRHVRVSRVRVRVCACVVLCGGEGYGSCAMVTSFFVAAYATAKAPLFMKT